MRAYICMHAYFPLVLNYKCKVYRILHILFYKIHEVDGDEDDEDEERDLVSRIPAGIPSTMQISNQI